MNMADRLEQPGRDYSDLLAELDRLEQEQRTLDLRDTDAVTECTRKIGCLKRRIALVTARQQ